MSLGASAPGPAWPAPSAASPAHAETRDRRRVAGVLVAMATVVAVLGAPLGLAWAAFAPDVPVQVTEQGLMFAVPQPEQPAAADGWFTLLAVPFGALVAGGAWLVVPRSRGPGAVTAVAAGATVAGLLAWWVGRQVGLAGYDAALVAAPDGTVLSRPADLRVATAGWWPPVAAGVPLLPGLFAAVTYTLLAAWSRLPSLLPEPSQPPDVPGP